MISKLLLPGVRQLALTIGALVLLIGCETDRGTAHRHEAASPPETAPVAAAPIPEMEARGMFFNGQVEVEVVLNRVGFAPREAAASDAGAGRDGGGGFRGGRGGGRRNGGGMSAGRAGGSTISDGHGGARPRTDGAPGGTIRAANEPPVRLHLRLTNHGNDAIEVEVPDFNSDLGNFVVQPRKLTLAAGSSIETDPMISRLGVKADEIALTVALRVNGRTDQQMLPLRIKPPAPLAAESVSPPVASPAP